MKQILVDFSFFKKKRKEICIYQYETCCRQVSNTQWKKYAEVGLQRGKSDLEVVRPRSSPSNGQVSRRPEKNADKLKRMGELFKCLLSDISQFIYIINKIGKHPHLLVSSLMSIEFHNLLTTVKVCQRYLTNHLHFILICDLSHFIKNFHTWPCCNQLRPSTV